MVISAFYGFNLYFREVLERGEGGAGTVISSKKWDFLKISSGWHGGTEKLWHSVVKFVHKVRFAYQLYGRWVVALRLGAYKSGYGENARGERGQ